MKRRCRRYQPRPHQASPSRIAAGRLTGLHKNPHLDRLCLLGLQTGAQLVAPGVHQWLLEESAIVRFAAWWCEDDVEPVLIPALGACPHRAQIPVLFPARATARPGRMRTRWRVPAAMVDLPPLKHAGACCLQGGKAAQDRCRTNLHTLSCLSCSDRFHTMAIASYKA